LGEIGESQVEVSDTETNEETVDNQDLTNGDNELPLSVSSEVRKNFTRNVGNTQRRKFR
jgi:hypothetical protein